MRDLICDAIAFAGGPFRLVAALILTTAFMLAVPYSLLALGALMGAI